MHQSDVRKRKIEIDSKIRNPLMSFDGAYTAAIPTFKFLVLCAHEKNRLAVAVMDGPRFRTISLVALHQPCLHVESLRFLRLRVVRQRPVSVLVN